MFVHYYIAAGEEVEDNKRVENEGEHEEQVKDEVQVIVPEKSRKRTRTQVCSVISVLPQSKMLSLYCGPLLS